MGISVFVFMIPFGTTTDFVSVVEIVFSLFSFFFSIFFIFFTSISFAFILISFTCSFNLIVFILVFSTTLRSFSTSFFNTCSTLFIFVFIDVSKSFNADIDSTSFTPPEVTTKVETSTLDKDPEVLNAEVGSFNIATNCLERAAALFPLITTTISTPKEDCVVVARSAVALDLKRKLLVSIHG